MIIEFTDKHDRVVIVDSEFICAIVENAEKDGTWSVVMSNGNFFWEVTKEMKDLVYEVWEEHNG